MSYQRREWVLVKSTLLQESPRREDSGLGEHLQQRFWQEGREVLQSALTELRDDIPEDDAAILVDCYGVDLYNRLLVDLRGVYYKDTAVPVPIFRRYFLTVNMYYFTQCDDMSVF